MRTIQLKILKIPGVSMPSGMARKLREKNFSKIWLYRAKLTPCLEILENAVPFATGSCGTFKADVLDEWKAPKKFMKTSLASRHVTPNLHRD